MWTIRPLHWTDEDRVLTLRGRAGVARVDGVSARSLVQSGAGWIALESDLIPQGYVIVQVLEDEIGGMVVEWGARSAECVEALFQEAERRYATLWAQVTPLEREAFERVGFVCVMQPDQDSVEDGDTGLYVMRRARRDV